MTTKTHDELNTRRAHQLTVDSFCGLVFLSCGTVATLQTDEGTEENTNETWITIAGDIQPMYVLEAAIAYLERVLDLCGETRLCYFSVVATPTPYSTLWKEYTGPSTSVTVTHTKPRQNAARSVWVVLDKDGNESPPYTTKEGAERVAAQVLGWSVEERRPCDDCAEMVDPADHCGHSSQYLCPDCYGVKA